MANIDLSPPSSDFTNLGIGLIPPVFDGLEYLGLFGSDATKSSRNYARGKPNGSIVGSPVFQPNYMSLDGDTSYLDTGVTETADMTVIAVTRSTDTLATQDQFFYILGNQTGVSIPRAPASGAGMALYFGSTTSLGWRPGYWSGSATVTGLVTATVDPKVWGYIEATAGGGGRYVTHRTQGVTAGGTTVATRDPVTPKLRAGDVPSVNSGTGDMAILIVFSRILSAAELLTMYAWVKAVLVKRGFVAAL